MRGGPFLAAVLLGVPGVVLHARVVHAQHRVPSATPSRGAVELVWAGAPGDIARLDAVIRSMLVRVGVETTSTTVPAIDPVQVLVPHTRSEGLIARAWIDLADPTLARLYLGDAASERFLVRPVPLPHGVDEVAREIVAQIAVITVEALLDGGEIGVTREQARAEVLASPAPTASPAPVEADPSPAPPPTVRDHPPSLTFDVGGRYEVSAFAPLIPVIHGPALTAAVVLPPSRRVHAVFEASAQYRFPVALDASPIGVALQGGAARLTASLVWRATETLALNVGGGAGIDVFQATPTRGANADAYVATPQTAGFFIVRLAAAAVVRVAAGVDLSLGVGLDVDPMAQPYDYVDGTTPVTLLRPWIVRPFALVGLSFSPQR